MYGIAFYATIYIKILILHIKLWHIKMAIITDLGKDKNQHEMLKIQQIFSKLYWCRLYVVFHNLDSQNAGLVDLKKDLN